MFVSVRERTNIIEFRKPGQRSFILQQFLTESVLLSLTGGFLGLILIFLGTVVINYCTILTCFLRSGILFSPFISGLIGIVAGYAPASSAARMNPVDAMGFSSELASTQFVSPANPPRKAVQASG